ncbi:MAG TPA: exosortase system-associated protein, TIGR04073 family [Verrucomicrobiae bacterium]|jgi:putative exosortase-associated protein (TIGR04073 family)|nr:exosortase system-associated protein, TIGR04073 family [Verrucomicrobiae bacterium]
MKNVWRMTALMLLLSATPAFADLTVGEYKWSDKLNRGLLNIISSPVEIARTVNVTSNKEGKAYGWTVGLLGGFGRTILRLGAGIIDTVTCPFDFPKDDKGPLIKPEYAWQEWAGNTTTV